jgi:hypothetical protein
MSKSAANAPACGHDVGEPSAIGDRFLAVIVRHLAAARQAQSAGTPHQTIVSGEVAPHFALC